jgi:hypothetical protein
LGRSLAARAAGSGFFLFLSSRAARGGASQQPNGWSCSAGVSGFDPDGEQHIRKTETGRPWLCIEFLPPLWAEEVSSGFGEWADFDKRLVSATGVLVVWEDREWFRTDEPKPDTVSAIQQFLLAERRTHDPEFSA